MDNKMRLIYSEKIDTLIKDADYYYGGQTEPTEDLISYLKEHNVKIPELPDDESRRRDVVRMMVRVWCSIEVLGLIDELVRDEHD